MKKIYLVRHGQSHSNAGGEAMINADIPLTELGQHQAEQVAYWLYETLGDNIDSIMVSKFLRTHQTAQPLVDKLGLTPTVIEGLQEFDYLSFTAIDGTSLNHRRQLADDYWVVFDVDDRAGEDSESYREFCTRVADVLEQFKAMPDGNHVVYTHGIWMSMLVWQILGQPYHNNERMRKFRQFEMSIRPRNCEVLRLTLHDDFPPAITKVRSCDNAPLDSHLT